MEIVLFNRVCIYNAKNNETILYGQYNGKSFYDKENRIEDDKRRFKRIEIEDITYELVFNDYRPDFYIKFSGKCSSIDEIRFYYEDNEIVNKNDIILHYPFEECKLKLDKDRSVIISTYCKNYSHRLDEWIRYNLQLGFSGIVVFDNSENKSNNINESVKYGVFEDSIEDICKRYTDKVVYINYPYSPIKGYCHTQIQRISLHIGVNEFKSKCRNIALIDADEFIYIPKDPSMKIEHFFQEYDTTITMRSNILTNKNSDDIINNNVLKIAQYIGEDMYTKTILKTDKIKYLEFINTPHKHYTQKILEKDTIIHYHCWLNERCKYKDTMEKTDIFSSL